MNHLAILKNPWFNLLLLGKKTIESRITQRRIKPYKQIKVDDIVYIKKSGVSFIGVKFRVDKVKFLYTNGTNLLKYYQNELKISDIYILEKMRGYRYISMIWIADLEFFTPHIKFHQKGQRSWIINYNPQQEEY
jgi:ASC-1-like (ASCH) protein